MECFWLSYGTDSERDIRMETFDFLVAPATGVDSLQKYVTNADAKSYDILCFHT